MTEEKPDLSMIIHLREVKDYETLIEILREAETSEERLREQIAQPEHTSYLALMPLRRTVEIEPCADPGTSGNAAGGSSKPTSSGYSRSLLIDAEVVGGATLKWQKDESELIYIATTPAKRGQGYGKAIIRAILQLMPQQGCHSLLVGTGNSSLDTIAFYQKCGFRMDHIRRDYFAYAWPPVWEDGILLQDMLVFRFVLSAESGDFGEEQ